ncbi:type II toxin-antitoxin system death-on-curing family toxin [Methylocapsa sp. S129]|uniref:type II toxin-antitoxin system death-on-curing family toxin n=1 Tax=Methylocapsa sp. S129 TaxID=1641869 RepID=UPI00131B6B65|nr:type II toxin-antitoxin system death-on-curing family toxin [Methylocapsa sp. S129]
MTGAEPIWIEELDVLTLHDRLLAFHGGPAGVRDEGLLKSALARARPLAAYGDSADWVDMAAVYTAEIFKNHPFVDGNKRTGFVAGILFLELNGYRFTATEAAAADSVLALAAGTLSEAGYMAFLRENVTSE